MRSSIVRGSLPSLSVMDGVRDAGAANYREGHITMFNELLLQLPAIQVDKMEKYNGFCGRSVYLVGVEQPAVNLSQSLPVAGLLSSAMIMICWRLLVCWLCEACFKPTPTTKHGALDRVDSAVVRTCPSVRLERQICLSGFAFDEVSHRNNRYDAAATDGW